MKKQAVFWALFLLVPLLGYQNCASPVEFGSDVNASLDTEPPKEAEPVNQVEVPDPILQKTCGNLSYVQPDGYIYNKLDVLIIADTSGSLQGKEMKAFEHGFRVFVENLDQEVDINFAVLPAHYKLIKDSNSWSKNWYADDQIFLTKQSKDNYPQVISSTNTLSTDIASIVSQRVTNNAMGESITDGGESGLFALGTLLNTQDLMLRAKNAGFFRPDAGLAIIFYSDENALCAQYPEGVERVPDGERNSDGRYREQAFLDDKCGDANNQSAIYNLLKEKFPSLPVIGSAIVYTEAPEAPQGEDEIGYGYIELVEMLGGPTIGLQDSGPAITKGLSFLSDLAKERLQLYDKFSFPVSPYPNSRLEISVKVDGDQQLDFDISTITNEVILGNNRGIAGSGIEINYCHHEQ